MPLLEIDIEARYARFRDAMNQIERQTQRSAANMSKAFDGVKKTLAGLGVSLSAGAVVAFVKNAIDAADTLNDLSKQTGIAVDTLGGLGFAAGQAGGSLESISDAAGKLNKSIAGAAGGNKEFAEGFKALGIDIRDAEGKLKTADQVLIEMANAFQGYADGPEKVAIAIRLLGKSGADMIGFLNDGGQAIQENIDFYKRYAGVTQETADRADAFNDSLGKINVLVGSFGRTLAAELLPSLEGVAEALLSSKENGDQFTEWAGRAAGAIQLLAAGGAAAAGVLDNIAIKAALAGNVVKALATLKPGKIGEALDEYSEAAQGSANAFSELYWNIRNPPPPNKFEALFGKLEGQIKDEGELLSTRNSFLQKYRNEDLISEKDYQKAKLAAQKESVENTKKLYDGQIAVLAASKQFAKNPAEAESIQGRIDDLHKKKQLIGVEKPRAPVLKSGGNAAGANRPVEDIPARLVDAENRSLERLSDRERDILADRLDFLSAYYQEDLVAIGDYYDARRAAQEEALRAQQANIDQEISNLEGLKPRDARQKVEIDSKIDALLEKRAALEQAAGRASIQLSIEQTRAAKAFEETLAGINAELLEQQGLLPQAAGIRFDLGNDRIKTRLTTERDSAAGRGDTATVAARDADLERLAALRNMTVARAQLNSLDEVAAGIQLSLTEATDRAYNSAKSGATTEMQSLRLVSDARMQAAADLQQVANAFEEVARASGDPRMIQQARAMQIEVENLAASADLVRERFEDAFTGPFESAIDKLISGTASFKDAIKGLFSGIASEMSRMVSQDLTKQLLGKDGPLGGAVDFFAGVFGGKSKAPESSADIADAITKVSPKDAALALQTQAVDANRAAMERLTQAAQGAAGALARLPGGTVPTPAGSLDVLSSADGEGIEGGEALEIPSDVNDVFDDFSSSAATAASGVAQLAAAADLGNGALSRLPAIVSLFQSIVAATSTSGGGGGGGWMSAIASFFTGGSGGSTMDYEAAVASTGMFAKGGLFEEGDVVPFAKGGIPDIVAAPTFFPMAGGKTGLMGEAGPEAIMPLARDKGGELAVRMVGERGNITLLPITRDHSGRMAVRSVDKAFASGGVFGAAEPTRWGGADSIRQQAATSALGARSDSVVVPLSMGGSDHGTTPGKAGDTYIQLSVTPPAGATRETAMQFGSNVARAIERSGRNR